jgi:hypothetical protein
MLPVRFAGDQMRRFVEGVDRGQIALFPECLEDWIGEVFHQKGSSFRRPNDPARVPRYASFPILARGPATEDHSHLHSAAPFCQ